MAAPGCRGRPTSTTCDVWIDLARLLEDAKFDAMFFADVIGLYGDADADFDVYVREGLQIPSNDPIAARRRARRRTPSTSVSR